MADYIEGKRPVIEALRADAAHFRAYGRQRSKIAKSKIFCARQSSTTPVKTVPRKVLDERSERGSHQGYGACEAVPAYPASPTF